MSAFLKLAGPLGIGAGMLIALATGVDAFGASIAVNDASFEQATGTMNNGFLGIGAEYGKTIGGWQYQRGSLLGLLPPSAGSYQTPFAPDGNNVATIGSPVGVAGYATISQTLAEQYAANTRYTLRVDVGNVDLAQVLAADAGIALTAGGQAVASSVDVDLLSILDLNPRFDTWTLTFVTGDVAPLGSIGIRLFSGSLINLASAVAFDNVRLDAEALPASVVPTPAAAGMGIAAVAATMLRRTRERAAL